MVGVADQPAKPRLLSTHTMMLNNQWDETNNIWDLVMSNFSFDRPTVTRVDGAMLDPAVVAAAVVATGATAAAVVGDTGAMVITAATEAATAEEDAVVVTVVVVMADTEEDIRLNSVTELDKCTSRPFSLRVFLTFPSSPLFI